MKDLQELTAEEPLLNMGQLLALAKHEIDYIHGVHMTGLDLKTKRDMYQVSLEKALDFLNRAHITLMAK